ncbi:MAG: hypothetical protein KGQ38_02760 [Actinomycetales bacterium]|nr:hypothetical protein [Actinomycetales bacterium]
MHAGNARSIAFGLIASLTLSLNLVALPTNVQAATATCNGLAATITSSARVITGTSGADVIVVQGSGVHTVSSGLGDDVICGSSNDDTIISGTGNDTVISGDGNDTVSTGTGDDTVSGGTGNDSVTTGSGNDKVNGDAGADSISSESGSDTLAGGAGNDTLSGGTEGDKITGETGSDSLSGGAGNDMMQGGADRDQLDTGPGTNYCASDKSDSIVGACTIDTTSPGISNASVTPTVSAGSTLTFIWTVNDNSGVDRSGVKIGGPSGWVTTWCGFGVEGTRISGTMQASVFSATCQVPANAVNTEYTAFFDATDVFGQAAKSSTANFRITGGATDASAPVVSNMALSAPSLTYGQSLDITYDVQDETGLQGVIAWVAYNGYGFANNQGRSYVNYGDYASVRLSGDEKEGKYLQRISLNDFAPAGEYTLWISVIDKLGNKVFYQTSTKFTVN